MDDLFLFDEDFILLEADNDEVEDPFADENSEDDGTTENEKNSDDNTKQNNNEEEPSGDSEESDDGKEVADDSADADTDNNDDSDDSGIDDPEKTGNEEEVEDEMTKSKRLFFFDNFEILFNTTLNFIDKLGNIKDGIIDENKKQAVLELEKKLLKQKNDINFLLKKKITSMSEENLDKLLLIFSTKTETIIDITKSLIKEVN